MKTFRHSRLGLCSDVQIRGKTIPYFSLVTRERARTKGAGAGTGTTRGRQKSRERVRENAIRAVAVDRWVGMVGVTAQEGEREPRREREN